MSNTTIELKYSLMKLIMELEDPSFLKELKSLIMGEVDPEYDWADDLTDEQIEMLKESSEQIKAGKYITSEQLREETKAFLEQKRKENK